MKYLNKNTLSEQIYQILKDDIISQKIKCGEKLTLKNLKEQFDVSSTPVREALTRLSKNGLVTYYSNIGVKVIELDNNDFRELYEFTREMDTLSVDLAMRNDNYDNLILDLGKNLRDNQFYLESNQLDKYIETSENFHIIFYNNCNNTRLQASSERTRYQLSICCLKYECNLENQRKLIEEHTKIYNAVLNKDIYLARREMYQHLTNSYDLLLESL
ncbi:MAG: GntR family transcriptional regulator [Terrisporobacter sp.]